MNALNAKLSTWPLGLAVAIGSGVGGGLRIAVAWAMLGWFGTHFPYGILAVNVGGSLVIGLLAALTAPHGVWPVSLPVRAGLMVGGCGGFTTFSFFSLQTFQLFEDGRWMTAAIYVALTAGLGLVAVWAGYVGAGFLTGRRAEERTDKTTT